MKITAVGLGAIGGFFAARLARSGADVSALMRGGSLAAVRERGLTLIEAAPGAVPGTPGSRFTVPVRAVEDAAELGVQDLVIIAVKTTGLQEVVRRLGPLIGPDTVVLSAMNGIQWWFFHGLSAEQASKPLRSIDPDGELGRRVPASQVLGCVTHMSCSVPQPAVIQQMAGQKIIFGEPMGGDPGASARCAEVMSAFARAGFEVEGSERIQQDIWYKLWGNMTMNPMSALTGATGDQLLDDPDTRQFMSQCMLEAGAVGARIGLPIAMTPEERHVITRKLGAFKTSMLQDVEASRPIELDALVASVIEIGERVGVSTPNLHHLMGMTRVFARVRGLY